MAEDFSLADKGLKIDTKEDLQNHVQSLIESNNIKHINLSGNTLGVPACEALGEILATKTTLEYADLHDIFTSRLLNEIPQALSFLLKGLLKCPNLHTIDLSDNAFGLNTKDPLIDFLSRHTPLKHLILNNNGMGPIAGTAIAEALVSLAERKAETAKAGKASNKLESIVCGRNRLENGSMAAWAKAYQSHDGIKSVKMIQNGIRPEGISLLLNEGLSKCRDLEVLDMQDNTFTFSGASALANAIKGWSVLRELGMGDAYLGRRGAIKVFETLSEGQNKAVEVLRLEYNNIPPAGVKALLNAATTSLPALRRVELNGNQFEEDDQSVEALSELLSERKEENGKDDDPADHWGIGDLDELEGEVSDDEEEEEKEDEAIEEEVEEETQQETVLRDADNAENEIVAQRNDPEVDELAKALEKTEI